MERTRFAERLMDRGDGSCNGPSSLTLVRCAITFFVVVLGVFMDSSCCVAAQESGDTVHVSYAMHSLTIGPGGHLNLLDTYLSPREYTAGLGNEINLSYETMRQLKCMNHRGVRQIVFDIRYASADNTSKEGGEQYALMHWSLAYYYSWRLIPRLRLLAGGMYDFNAGVLYNSRNSNNPAQAKLYTRLSVSSQAIYNVSMSHYNFALRYQVDLPLAGLTFSPDYGQSYYEVFSLGQPRHNVCFIYPVNSPSWRHTLSADFPVGPLTLRAMGRMEAFQSKVNHLKCHVYALDALIGFVWYVHRMQPKKTVDANLLF
jgi:hypothetical protein